MTKNQLLDIRRILSLYYADIEQLLGRTTCSALIDGYLKSRKLVIELIKAINLELSVRRETE